MEAAWLAAVILAPLFFNVYSSRIFEPDKITLLRTLALVTLAAWIVKLVDDGRIHWETIQPGESRLKTILGLPLVVPTLALAAVYLISTLFSVTPRVSLLGSYQRLQGTYSTLSYLVFFAAVIGNLRKRAQIERLVTTLILTSLPIALYGVLQRYKLDPIPWGGDTSIRIAANMGNSIFVAAYLIMVFPLTAGRIVEAFQAILQDAGRLSVQVVRATIYVFIAALQMIALYMSQSRGPALGWMAGSFFLFLLLSLHWRKRWLTLATVGVAGALAVFLVIFNIPNGPLEKLRDSPTVGRFGLLLDAESNSALVRRYIWEGTVKLVAPHAPLNYPDGSVDRFNFLRPVIGYGPEAMYVAYNPFYIPELAYVEKRNASPDRSHNETWDSLVITGVVGLVVYLAVFASVFYFGLKWLGLISTPRQRNAFFILFAGSGIVGAVVFSAWRGIAYFGLGLPFGIILGLIGYLTLAAMFATLGPPLKAGEAARNLLMITLLSAIVAHFAEINFGIAIAVTRTYFWIFSGLLFVLGYLMPGLGGYTQTAAPEYQAGESHPKVEKITAAKGKKRRAARQSRQGYLYRNPWLREALISGTIIGFMLIILGFEYITNRFPAGSSLAYIWNSFTQLGESGRPSFGILGLILMTWAFGSVLFSSESVKIREQEDWWKLFGAVLGISILIALVYWLWHTGNLAAMVGRQASSIEDVLRQVGSYEGVLALFYFFVYLFIFGLGFVLQERLPDESSTRVRATSWQGLVSAPVLLLAVIGVAAYTNLRVVQADIVFKLTDPFTRGGSWPVAIEIYNRANQLAPNEDYYYLFLGRAYLEYAKTLTDAAQRDAVIEQAAADLKKAQAINPLNTDHTANLGRLYSLWANYATDPADRAAKAKTSADYFSRAVVISPNNARLWDEWALLEMNINQQYDEAFRLANTGLQIDPKYDFTQSVLGDYYIRQYQAASDQAAKDQDLANAITHYSQAVALATDATSLINYRVTLANLYIQTNQYTQAIQVLKDVISFVPTSSDNWRYQQTVAQLYWQLKDKSNALLYANDALGTAPDDQKGSIQSFIAQVQAAP
jgi:tetratricopeptide (TPR) repeat protein